MANIRKDQKGFALVAVVILLTVFGLLLTTFTPTKAVNSYAKYTETKRRMEVITKAMENYRQQDENGYYPCPASRKVPVGSTDFGKACASTASCPGDGWACPNSGGSQVYIGAVPTYTLNLSDEYMFDGWGNRFIYAIDRYKLDGNGAPILRIKTLATPEEYLINPPPYYLASVGPNGTGGYNMSGQVPAGKACTDSTDTDKPNCMDTNYEFISDKWVTTGGTKTGATRPFDDIMANSDRKSYYQCPAGVSGCAVWLDASDIDADGMEDDLNDTDTIEQWSDKSGNGYDVTQSNGSYLPAYTTTGTANNKPSVKFDGTGDRLVNEDFKGAAQSTIFIVAKQESPNNDHRRMFHAGSSTDAVIFVGAYNGNLAVGYGNTSGWTAFPAALSPEFATSSYTIYTTTHDSSAERSFPYINGARRTAVYGATVPYQGFMVGASSDGSQSWGGDIAELIVYNRVLNANERTSVECYLGAKYDLPSPCDCPARVGGCQLWLTADDLDGDGDFADENTDHPDGEEVQSWLDKSGNGHSAQQPTLAYQPTIVYEAINGAKAVRTDGVNDVLKITDINIGVPYTVIMAYQPLSGNMGRTLSGDSGTGANWLLGAWYDGTGTSYSTGYFAGDWVYRNNANSLDPYILTGTNNGTSSASYLNGSAMGQQNYNANWGDNLLIGSWSATSPSENGKVNLGELLIYPYVLSSAERKKIECYLGRKYGITIAGCN